MTAARRTGPALLAAFAAVTTLAAPAVASPAATPPPAAAPGTGAGAAAACTGTAPVVCHFDVAPGTYLDQPQLFPTVRPLIRRGDTVLIQLAHNDKQTTEADYRANLTTMIDAIRGQGGRPVLVTPIVRRWFNADDTLDNGTALLVNGLGVDLSAQIRLLATERHVPLIDLTALTRQRVEELGPDGSKVLYPTDEQRDNTHTSERGATEYAATVRDALRAQHLLPAGLFR